MSPRYDDKWIADLLNAEWRLGSTRPEEFLRDSGLRQGMTVIDYGCGPGFFTLPAARIVGPDGIVYALDIEQKMVALIGDRAAELGLDNVKAVLNEAHAAPLPDAVVDFAICALVWHYCDGHKGRVRLAEDLGRLVRRGGQVLIIQWEPGARDEPGRDTSFEELAAVLAEADFQCDDPHPMGERHYRVIATKSGAKGGRATAGGKGSDDQ